MKRFILLILLFIFLLRIPSFFEPYWYGDEGIYLAIGQAMQRGAVLYRDIWDNKPPLLYLIYAIVPTLLWAKITATVFVLGTVTGVYLLAKKLKAFPAATALTVGVLLSLPIFEGTIANAELYFTLPIVLAAYFVYNKFISSSSSLKIKDSFIVGIFLTVAFLIKVPAVFDFLGILLVYSIVKFTPGNLRSYLMNQFKSFAPVIIPFIITLGALAIYFRINNALGDFISASFSQNASYIAVDTGPLSKLSNPLFTHGAILLLVLALMTILYVKKRVSKELLFLASWSGFSIYGALLSGRPYPHYLLQIVPPVTLLIAHLFTNLKKNLWVFMLLLIVLLQLGNLFGKQLYFLQGLFSKGEVPYYSNFFDYISERKSWEQYINYFDARTSRNYQIADYLKANSKSDDTIFVWGDNAFVYVLSQRRPTTKFIQAHHLTTIPAVNYQLIMQRLDKYRPKFVIISYPIGFQFPELETFVKKNYRWVTSFQDLYVYQYIGPKNPAPFSQNY